MSISIDTLKEAISIKEQIASLEARLSKLLGGGGGDGPFPFLKLIKKGRRTMSAAARAKIAAAQKLRWAKQKGTSAPAAKPGKKKGGITAAGRARLAAVMKARWAARKKAGAPALNTPKKK